MMISKFAFETPIKSLDMQATHGDYLFGIATWAEKHPDYARFLITHSENADLYLDNGAYEEGQSIDIPSYLTIIESLMPNVVVVPDVISNAAKTIQMSKLFFAEANRLPNYIKFMIVPQGKSVEEWNYCLHVMIRMFRHKFSMIGIPKCIYPHRLQLVRHVLKFARGKEIHLLGCQDISELTSIFNSRVAVASVDTSWPARQALGLLKPNDRIDFVNDKLDFDKFSNQVQRFLKLCKEGVDV